LNIKEARNKENFQSWSVRDRPNVFFLEKEKKRFFFPMGIFSR